MKKKFRNSFIVLLLALVLIVALIIISNHVIKEKVEYFIENRLPNYISQSNSSIDLNSFEGTITINNPIISIKNIDNETIHTKVSLEKIVVEDVSYWDYFFNSEIHIEDIKFLKPKVTYFQDTYQKNKNKDTTTGILKIYKPFIIDQLSIDNATLNIYNKSKDSLLLYIENSMVEINMIEINNQTINKKLPVIFKEYKFSADSIYLKANNFENLTASKIKLENNEAIIKHIDFKTKYSRKKMSKTTNKERDHFDLSVDGLSLSGLDFGFKKRNLFVKINAMQINNPILKIFRDKLVENDTNIKKLYSQTIREVPFNLTLKTINLNNAKITYTEKVKPENDGGTIEFDRLNAKIKNVSNTYKAPLNTTLDISGYFMKMTPFKVNWSFDVNSLNDNFVFKMDMNALDFSKINAFTEPNLKVRFGGKVNKMYFTIDGDKSKSTVDIKVDYEDLKINVLNKNGKEKNWLLSKMANLFISKNSKDKKNDFREAKTEVERDKTKSVFNFIWLNTSQGLLKSIAGDGEKNKK